MSQSEKISLGVWFAFTGIEKDYPDAIAHGHGTLVEKVYHEVPPGTITFAEWQEIAQGAALVTAAYINEQLVKREIPVKPVDTSWLYSINNSHNVKND
jgi:hypothetical protein